ncbi:sulfotransferase 4A1 [Narcine bancroftii]|uniref:sulfotransferase 4A1 n=1 Tax=Narcine bancroftii TaxID=1343680 RepID=UPI003832257F
MLPAGAGTSAYQAGVATATSGSQEYLEDAVFGIVVVLNGFESPLQATIQVDEGEGDPSDGLLHLWSCGLISDSVLYSNYTVIVHNNKPSSSLWFFLPGTSLLQELVYLVNQDADPDEIGIMNIDEQLPVLEYPQPGLDIIKELTSPRLIKSHLPYRFLPTDLHNGQSKVICMARNPKDLVVSYYQFHRSLRTMSYRGTFQEFCRRFVNDKLGYGSWFEHVQEFWEHRMDSNVLFLLYEDLHKNLARTVELLVRFLGVTYDKTQMEAIIEHCHQLVDQCCNAEALPIGRVRVGLWKDIFTVSMNEKFDAVFKQKMGKSDLNFDFSL